MSEESNNPFAQPGAESAPIRDTSRRSLLIGALAIVAVDQFSRQLGRNGMVSIILQDGDLAKTGAFYTNAAIAGLFGPLLGALLAIVAGGRRALIAGAALGALVEAVMAIEPVVEVAYAGALVRGMIWTPLVVLVGRRLVGAPELRDAWFTATIPAMTISGFLAGLASYGRSFVPVEVTFAAAAALSLAIIPIALSTLHDTKLKEASPRAGSVSVLVVLGVVLLVANAFTEQLISIHRDRSDIFLNVGTGLVSLLGGIAAAIVYMARHTPEHADDAKSKVALGALLGTFATALLAAVLVAPDAPATTWAALLLQQAAYLMIWPIALGVTATRLRERDAYLAVMVFSIATALSSNASGMLVAWTQHYFALEWVAAGASAAIAISLFVARARTDSGTRSS